MTRTGIHLEWCRTPGRQFRTGLSLHSHTLHSHESLDFIYALANRIAPAGWVLRQGEARYFASRGYRLDLRRAWWTPPCAPYEAWLLEKNQIEQRLQLSALVSVTDHDSIEAPLRLRTLDACRHTPVALEWTIPVDGTFFHLGVHNLPADTAQQVYRELKEFTAAPRSRDLRSILSSLANNPDTLIVFNHPCWDEKRIGAEKHIELAAGFLSRHGQLIHALELNGLRPWKENKRVLQMAHAFNRPLVSGGDRHGLEPNTILDLSNAKTFSEFVQQVRSGHTDVLITNQYREPFRLRILRGLQEILDDHHPAGRRCECWRDRVFYQCDDGVARSLAELSPSCFPVAVQWFVNTIGLLRYAFVQQAFRVILGQKQELAV